MAKEYDLVVLGGGTGGYVGAIRAAQLGMNVAIVEKEKLGGTCLHKGCIPSKALLKSAEMYRIMQDVDQFGIKAENITIDFKQMQERKEEIVGQLYNGIQLLMKKNKIDVYEGHGTILGSSIFSPIPGTISVEHADGSENTMLIPKNVLLATGSKPRTLSILPIDGEVVLHSDHTLQLDELPASMTIIGGGVIGVEWASLLIDLGVAVTVIEYAEDILPTEDHDLQKAIRKSLEKRGVQFFTNSSVTQADINENGVSLTVGNANDEIKIKTDKVLLSVGREANIDQIGLTNTSIEVKNNFIQTNTYYQTEETHIYAIGDCIGGMQLAHVASKEAMIAVEHMAENNPDTLDSSMIPSCIYSYPEASSIGWTEIEATEHGIPIQVGKFPYQAIGKSHVNGEVEGFCKIIVHEETDDIIGVHIVGDQATELIGEASLAKFLDASGWELQETIHAHPSLTELFAEAALAVENKQIHG